MDQRVQEVLQAASEANQCIAKYTSPTKSTSYLGILKSKLLAFFGISKDKGDNDNNPGKQPRPASAYELQLQLEKYGWSYANAANENAKIFAAINKTFCRRVLEAEEEAEGDLDLKLVTYQEWVENLQNTLLEELHNTKDLAETVQKELQRIRQEAEARKKEAIAAYKHDINLLIRVYRNGYRSDDWHIEDQPYKTLTSQQLMELKQCHSRYSETPRARK